MKPKVALFISGGYERGYHAGAQTLIDLVKSWDVEDVKSFELTSDDIDESCFLRIQKLYSEGYKIISAGIPLNSLLSSMMGLDVIDPEDINKKDPDTLFEKYYLNKGEVEFTVENVKFKCLPIYHPLYTFENQRQAGVHKQVLLLRDYIGLEPTEKSKVLHSCFSYQEFKNFIDMYDRSKNYNVTFDVETNFVSPLMKDFRITGFSLAFNSKEGVYIVLESSDFSMSEDERSKCMSLLKEILSDEKSRVCVHNLKMEVPAVLNNLDYEIPKTKIDDTLVWSKLINSGRVGGNGLKEQAAYRRGYSDWSIDVDIIQEIKSSIKKDLSSVDRKGNPKYDASTYERQDLEEILQKYYPDTFKEVSRELILKINTTDNYLSFGLIPSRVLEKYGALDAIATFDIWEWFTDVETPRINKKLNIDLFVGYDLWLESQYASYLLELNSSRWDESQASSDEKRFTSIMVEDLSALLSADHPSMRDHVKSAIGYNVMKDLFESGEFKNDIENHERFRGYTGTGKIRYDLDGKVKNINPDKYQDIMEIFNLSKNKMSFKVNIEYERLISTKFEGYSLKDLLGILNPNSDYGKKIIIDIIQDDITKSSKFILDCSNYLKTETYSIDKANKEFNAGELKLLEIIGEYDQNLKPQQKFELYERIMEQLGNIQIGSKLSKMIVEAGNWKLEKIEEWHMTELYTLYTAAGYDIDNDHDGDTPFARLFHIRRYRKVDKLLSVYIYGSKLGRSQVYVVDKEEFQSGKKLVTRKRPYTPGEKIAEDEDLLFQGQWGANSVLSGRWSSGVHTIPAWSDPKRYLSSRFRGGCSVIADFSQAELRVVARASNEENLINAYKSGIDVHLNTAMNIFKKPANEISEVERRFSKMGCLVGNTKIKLMNGTTKTIEEIYEDWSKSRVPFHVPSYDKEKGLAVGRCINVQLTKYTDEICRVTFDDGNILECTPDHPLLLKGKENKYVKSEESLNSEIEALYYKRIPNHEKYVFSGKEIHWDSTMCNRPSKKVVKVEILKLETPVPVYDLSVEKYHNYCVDFCDGSGIYVHNTFHILYGGNPQGFATSYLNGDLATAEKIFDGFYGGYPKLKIWKDAREKEVETYGLVTTMTNRYIFLGHEQPGVNLGKILRQSGNAPIQGPSSDIAASAVYNISKFIEDRHLKSKLYCFVHDSIEADVEPSELFYVMESFQYQMNNYPVERFNVPAKSDLTLGATLGEEVEVVDYKPDEDYKGGWLHLEGNGDEVDRLLARWSEFWDHMDIKWIKRKYSYNSYRELFAVKRSYTRRIGGMNSKVELEVRLRFDKGLGCKDKFQDYDKLFPLEDPIIYDEYSPYDEYKSGEVSIYLDKGLKGFYKKPDGSMVEISFENKEKVEEYVKSWKFEKIGKVGLKM